MSSSLFMKFNIALSIIFMIMINKTLAGQDQETKKEVLLVGTMHQVPKFLQNAYKPLFKKTLSYNPGKIYVETAMPNDTASWEYLKVGYSSFHRSFYSLSDSLKKNYDFNEVEFNNVLEKKLENLTAEDLKKLIKGFAYQRDVSNFSYYKHIEKYGLVSKKKFRNENQALTAKLAIALEHKKVYATDDQRTNEKFHANWKNCEEEIIGTEFEKKYKKLSKRLVLRIIPPAIFGRYGPSSNKWKNLESLHSISGMFFSQGSCSSCDRAINYWNQRNDRIAYNLGTQIEKSSAKKSILIIGAAHVVGLKKSLQEQFPKITVLLYDEIK